MGRVIKARQRKCWGWPESFGRHCEGEIEGRRLRQARAVRRERQEVESPRKGEKVAEGLAPCARNPRHVRASIIRTQTDACAAGRSPLDESIPSNSAIGCNCSTRCDTSLTMTMMGMLSSIPQMPHSQPQNNSDI